MSFEFFSISISFFNSFIALFYNAYFLLRVLISFLLLRSIDNRLSILSYNVETSSSLFLSWLLSYPKFYNISKLLSTIIS